jgi:hypothetical protein
LFRSALSISVHAAFCEFPFGPLLQATGVPQTEAKLKLLAGFCHAGVNRSRASACKIMRLDGFATPNFKNHSAYERTVKSTGRAEKNDKNVAIA